MADIRVPLVDEADYGAVMEGVVLPALARCRSEGWMEPACDGGLAAVPTPGNLHYVCYDVRRFAELGVEGAWATVRGAVVISHGFTEFAAKYSELAWYFLLAGYSVCILEHRGHGCSVRDVSDPSLVWIDDWRRYVQDLAKFASSVGAAYAQGDSLCLFAHSMGGGIGAAVLQTHPALFDRAVLTAPMIEPALGMPRWVAGLLGDAIGAMGMGRRMVYAHERFSGVFDETAHEGASMARVRWCHGLRVSDERYQTNAASYGWVRQSVGLSRFVMARRSCAAVETEVLLCQAGRDVWVRNEAQRVFAQRVRDGGTPVRLVRFDRAVHEIFSMPNDTLGEYLRTVLGFLAG